MTRMLHRQDRRCLGPCRTPAKPWLASWTPQAPACHALKFKIIDGPAKAWKKAACGLRALAALGTLRPCTVMMPSMSAGSGHRSYPSSGRPLAHWPA